MKYQQLTLKLFPKIKKQDRKPNAIQHCTGKLNRQDLDKKKLKGSHDAEAPIL